MAGLLVAPLAIGAMAAVGQALVFELVTRQAGWQIGAVLGAMQGGLMAALVGVAPWMAERMGHRSASLVAFSPIGVPHPVLGLAALLAAGTVFGAVVGAAYGAARHSREAHTHVWWREVHPTPRRFPT